MPVYQYHCSTCGKDFEASQRMSDPALTACACGAEGTVQRLVGTGAGVIFRGSGFYGTDYKSSGAKAEAAKAESAKEGAAATAPAPASTGHTCGGPNCGCSS